MLDRAALHELLSELAGRLDRRGLRANLYIIGGAAMAMLFDDRRATRDIDSVVLSGHGPLIEEVRAMARIHDLPSTWLNEQASVYVSAAEDPNQSTVFDHAALSVAAASAEHLLAMKVSAGRASDVGDIKALLSILRIDSVAQVEAVLADVFPDSALSDRARLIVEDILAAT
jgi:Nucleotidyltransferase of unknown function (DUF6036)